MTFVIRQLKHNCEAVSWHPGKFHNAIQTTMNVVFTQMTCCANFLECEMWHKQFPSLTAASECQTVRCQGWDPGDNGLASCLMGQHPVPGLATLWQLSRNKWGKIGQANESLEGAVWWSILAGLPRQIKWKLSRFCEILFLNELPAICVLCAVADWCVSDGIFLWHRNWLFLALFGYFVVLR